MLIRKIHLPRRTVLKALGATVGLPLLDAMIPAGTAGRSWALGRTAASPRLSMSFIYFPHGAVLDQWTPRRDEAGLELPPILAPLAPFRHQLTVISGLENKAAVAPPVHAITPATWLSCERPGISSGVKHAGMTLDQLVARKLGQDMPFDSIQVATEVAGGEGASDRVYGDAYARTISFRSEPVLPVALDPRGGTCGHRDPSAGTSFDGDPHAKKMSARASVMPLPMEHDPRKLFRRLFGPDAAGVARQVSSARVAVPEPGGAVAESRSVLDLVRHNAADLSRKLGPRDRAVLADYFDSVRAIERRVAAFVPADCCASPAHPASDRGVTSRSLPSGASVALTPDTSGEELAANASSQAPTRFDEHIRLMFDLIALAYQANATRVATFMMAAEVSNQQYDFIGIPDSFHSLSHHGNSPAKLERLARVQACNTALFAEFIGKLAAMPDGDGSMLDHSLIVYGSNMGNSNRHDHSELPLALLGGACGKLAGNRHVRCPERTPLANLHLALLNKVGIEARAFGDSTGELTSV